MRLKVIHYMFLAWTATALASDSLETKPRPPRHLHQIKELIVNKLLGSKPEQPEPKFYQIPGFDSVVIKAVPKTPTEPPPIADEIPPNSQIGIIGSYLGTSTLNDTFNALQGVKNLLNSGILTARHGALDELALLKPTRVQNIALPHVRSVKPCSKPALISPAPVEPIRVLVAPPKVPELVPTQYSYKQVNRDGSLTTYTSSLDLQNGVKVTEDGKTLPFFVDRIQKIPVRLPVPVLPDVSKIIISNPFDGTYRRYPVGAIHPGSAYSYKQLNRDGSLISYSGLPTISEVYGGAVVVTEMEKAIPPPPVFLMNRIEKVAAAALHPKVPLMQPKPMLVDVGAGHIVYNDPPLVSHVPVSGPGKYSYTQIYNNPRKGGNTIAQSASSSFDLQNPPVQLSNPSGPPASGSSAFSYNQAYSGGKMTSFTGSSIQEEFGGVPVPVVSRFQSMPPVSNSYSYKQFGNGKVTTYNGDGIVEESYGVNPAVILRSVNHPVPPPHIADRIEKVAAGAKFNRPPVTTMFFGNPFTVPVPTGFVRVPSVHTSTPQQPVKIPSTSGMSPFIYKHINKDGSVTSYGEDGAVTAEVKSQAPNMPIPPGYHRVFESPINSGPFPIEVNTNAIKPSSPVSGSYSYKLVNSGLVNIPEDQNNITPPDVPVSNNQPFPVPPPMPIMHAPPLGCVDPDVVDPNVAPAPVVFQEPVIPLSYTYKQISHSKPGEFLVVNVEDPMRDMKKVHERIGLNDQVNQQYPDAFPAGEKHRNPTNYLVPPPSNRPPITESVPRIPQEATPPSSFSYKQVSNEGVYEYNNNLGSSDPNQNNYLVPPPSNRPPITESVPRISQEATPPSPFSYKQVSNEGVYEYNNTRNLGSSDPNQNNYLVPPPSNRPPISESVPRIPQEATPPSSFSYKQVSNEGVYEYNNNFGSSDPNQNSNNYLLPPPSNRPPITESVPQIPQEATPPSSFSYKQVSNEGVYEYNNNFGSSDTDIKTNRPEHMETPQENSAGNTEQEPMEISSSTPIINNRNALADNPIVVPEQASFSFRQSNMDGSSITVKDNGQNSLTVDVEPARPASQSQEPPRIHTEEENSSPNPPVQEHTTPAGAEQLQESPKTETSSRRKMVRRRKIKRVTKPRGDIPEAES